MWGMALMAQEWSANLEHVLGRGSMRVVAIPAVLADRFVVMDERTALFHVTGVAGGIYAVPDHKLGSGRTMGVMTVRAAHLAFWNRMVRRPVDLGALFFVVGETDLGLSSLVTHSVIRGVHLMAIRAGHVPQLVGTACPMRTFGVLLVTTCARLVANVGG